MGDLNAKYPTWDQTNQNRNETILNNASEDLPYCVEHPDEPTFPRGGSTLDIIINNNTTIASPQTVSKMESDHLPIQFEIKSSNATVVEELMFQYDKCEWTKYHRYINENLQLTSVDSPTEIERALTYLNNTIRLAITQSTPLRERLQPNQVPTPTIRALLREKRRLRPLYQCTRDPRVWTKVTELSDLINNKLTETKTNGFHHKLKNLV